jgi:uncharacterized protein
MRKAIGMSLLVIALKSFTGLAGHLSYVTIDLTLASVVAAVAVIGTLIGSALSRRVSAEQLRTAFAWFVLAVAGFMLYKQLPQALLQQIFVARWPFWIGGAAVGGFLLLFLLSDKQMLGVSTGFEDMCAAPFDARARRSWRLPFMAGIIAGGLLAASLAGHLVPTTAMGAFDQMWHASFPVKAGLFTLGGVLIGFRTRLAGGCTSGHGISGVAQLAPASLIATGSFMLSGFLTTQLLLQLLVG